MNFFRKNKFFRIFVFLAGIAVATILNGTQPCPADNPVSGCTVVVSRKIKPYLEAVEGIRDGFNQFEHIDPEYHYLQDIEKSWIENESFLKGSYGRHSIIAVGPEAVLFLKENPPDKHVHKIFSMVLNPSGIISENDSFCGIFLTMDAGEQIKWIRKTAPGISNLGILYDPVNNSDYLSMAVQNALIHDITIIPLSVGSNDEVPELLRKSWQRIDGLLLIPDATIISSSLVTSIIKDGLSNNVPVIGYNSFFIRNGALLAFVYDYKKIGMETADLVNTIIKNEGICQTRAAQFDVMINTPIAKQLNIDIVYPPERSEVKN